MIALSSWPSPGQPARALGETGYIRLPFRCRQQEIDRHAERLSDLLMQRHGAFALSPFEVGQIALSNFDGGSKLGLRHGAPFAQHMDWILTRRQPIDDRLWHHDLTTGRDLVTRGAHDASCADILAGDEFGEPLIFTLRKNSEFLAARGLDELNLGHDPHDINIANGNNILKRDIAYCYSARHQ